MNPTRFIKPLAIVCAGLMLGLLAPRASAAPVVLVPTDEATIQAAIDAVDTGGLVRIVDSGVYQEDLNISKPGIRIVAAVGENPTIASTGTNNFAILPNASGSNYRLGSNSGGRITVDTTNSASLTKVINMSSQTAGTFTVENVEFVNITETLIDPRAGAHTLNLINVEALDLPAFAIRLDFMDAAATFNIEGCTLSSSGQVIFNGTNGAEGNVNITRSDISSTGGNAIQISSGGAHNITIDRSFVHGPGANAAVYVLRSPVNLTITNSALYNSGGGGNGLYVFMDSGGPAELTIDNSDILKGPSGFVGFRYIDGSVTNMSITDSNISDFNGTPDGTLTLDYNNVITGTYSGFTAGANDVSVDPVYTDAAGGDFTYAEASLLTADSGGGPIGSAATLADFVPVELSTMSVE